jgi:ArsR family transcriptional regulator, zinc-responsive transcriptional repressor
MEDNVATFNRTESSKQCASKMAAETALFEIHPDTPSLLDEHFQTVSFLAKSLSDENRLRILLCISSGKKSVGGIVEELGLSQPLVSHHLKELKRSLLVRIERSGPFIYYELSDARILDVVRTLSTVAADLLADRKTF